MIWTGKDAVKAKKCQNIIGGVGAAGDAFKEPSEVVPAVPCKDVEMTSVVEAPEIAFPVFDVVEESSIVMKGTPLVIKTERVDEDSVENTLACMR